MDLETIASLLKLLSDHDVSKFQFRDDDMELELELGPQIVQAAAPPMAPAPAPVAAPDGKSVG
jgi:hypothetical protein